MSCSRDVPVVGANVLGEALVLVAELIGRRGHAGNEDVHVIRAAAEHAAGCTGPDLAHIAAADQIGDRARLDKRKPDTLAAHRRAEGHPLSERGVVLHVVERGEAARRPGKARIRRHIRDPLAINEQQAVIAQRLQQFLAGANGHLAFPLSQQRSAVSSLV